MAELSGVPLVVANQASGHGALVHRQLADVGRGVGMKHGEDR